MARPFYRRHAQGLTFAGLCVVSLAMLVFSTRALVVRPKEIGLTAVSFFQSAAHGVGNWVSGTINAIGELRRLRAEVDSLRSQIVSYERSQVDISELQIENNALREQLGLTKAFAYDQIPAEVIAVDPTAFSTIAVNKGASKGVRPGMAVVAFQGGLRGLVGRVMVVGETTSLVMPIYDAGSWVSGRHQGSRYEGLVRGNGLIGGKLTMTLVPKAARSELGFGDIVLTSGLGGLYPEGLHIGRIEEVNPLPYEESLELVLDPVIDFSRLEYVFILDPGMGEP